MRADDVAESSRFLGLGKLRVPREVCRALFASFLPTLTIAILQRTGCGYEKVVMQGARRGRRYAPYHTKFLIYTNQLESWSSRPLW